MEVKVEAEGTNVDGVMGKCDEEADEDNGENRCV
jgi:hypothetical protein